jgi:predicted transcriptional regulator of viral defense system
MSGFMRAQAEKLLFEIAETQDGFFTSEQATEAGFPPHKHAEWVKKGKWEKAYEGIYRLTDYPEITLPQLMLWSLWARGSHGEMQGAYSHETALALFHLTPHLPSPLQMTVPLSFRRYPPDPDFLRVYYDDLLRSDTTFIDKIKVTTPVRSIVDVIVEGALPADVTKDALYYALERKLIESEEALFLYPKVVEVPALEAKVRKYLRDAS